jgi:RNA polymerase sigma factor (sigma-70 family)
MKFKHGPRRDLPLVGMPITDACSFEAAFSENFPSVHRFLARRVGSSLADDLAAETFALAYRRRVTYDPARGAVRPWLLGIATHLLRGHWREERRLLALEARLATQSRGATAGCDEAALADAVAPHLARALERLSGGERDVLLLHPWAELSSDEIAAALGLRAGTVRSRLSRARARLRDELDARDPDPLRPTPTTEPLPKECPT